MNEGQRTIRLEEVFAAIPEDEQEEARARFRRYLEVVIEEADARAGRLTDDDDPLTLSYSI